jgi:thioredoxin 1
MVHELNESNFDRTIAKGISIIDFWAPWCGPCKMMTPIIEKIAEDNTEIIVGKVNIDKSQSIAQKFNVLSIPTILIMKDGEPMEQTVGVVSASTILQKIEKVK